MTESLPEVPTCVQHIAPAMRPPYHDHGHCRCLITHEVTLAAPGRRGLWKEGERPSVERGRYQREFIEPRLNAILEGVKALRARRGH